MKPITPSHVRRRLLLLGACAMACGIALPVQASPWDWGHGEPVQGNGNVKRQARAVGHFSGIALALPGSVEVRSGQKEGLTVETDDNLLPLIETVVEDGTLQIRNRRGSNVRTRHLKIVVGARELERLAIGGSGSIDADRMAGADLRFDIGGSGSIAVGSIEGERVTINLGGTGGLKAGDGNTRNLSISVGGSGKTDLARLRADSASVTIAGSGDATLWVRDKLSLTVAGSGDVGYYGDPQVSKSVMGSGTVRRLGPAPR